MGKQQTKRIRVPGYLEARAVGDGPAPADMLRAMKSGARRAKLAEESSPIDRATALTAQDKRQRWVTTDGEIHTKPVPYRDAVSVRWAPIPAVVIVTRRSAALAHSAIEAGQ